jgi:hypothetical protein
LDWRSAPKANLNMSGWLPVGSKEIGRSSAAESKPVENALRGFKRKVQQVDNHQKNQTKFRSGAAAASSGLPPASTSDAIIRTTAPFIWSAHFSRLEPHNLNSDRKESSLMWLSADSQWIKSLALMCVGF